MKTRYWLEYILTNHTPFINNDLTAFDSTRCFCNFIEVINMLLSILNNRRRIKRINVDVSNEYVEDWNNSWRKEFGNR